MIWQQGWVNSNTTQWGKDCLFYLNCRGYIRKQGGHSVIASREIWFFFQATNITCLQGMMVDANRCCTVAIKLDDEICWKTAVWMTLVFLSDWNLCSWMHSYPLNGNGTVKKETTVQTLMKMYVQCCLYMYIVLLYIPVGIHSGLGLDTRLQPTSIWLPFYTVLEKIHFLRQIGHTKRTSYMHLSYCLKMNQI